MRYWYHRESESYFTTSDDDYDPSGDGMSMELDRVEYLTSVAVHALKSAASNDGVVPRDNREAASEMVEQAVFGPTEDCLDEGGEVREEYVLAVASARLLLRGAS